MWMIDYVSGLSSTQSVKNVFSKCGEQWAVSSPPTAQRDREARKTEAMIVGVDRAASQMEDLQSADSLLGRRRRALIRAAASSTIHPLLYSFSPRRHQQTLHRCSFPWPDDHDHGGDDEDRHLASCFMFLSISAWSEPCPPPSSLFLLHSSIQHSCTARRFFLANDDQWWPIRSPFKRSSYHHHNLQLSPL